MSETFTRVVEEINRHVRVAKWELLVAVVDDLKDQAAAAAADQRVHEALNIVAARYQLQAELLQEEVALPLDR